MPKQKKVKLSITVDSELVDWIDQQIQKKTFSSRSHAFEYAIAKLREKEGKG